MSLDIQTMNNKRREPSGRLSRSGEEKELAPALIRRLRDAALSKAANPRWGTELGRLYLAEQINAAQFVAGEKWAELVIKYHSAIGAPPPYPKPIALQRGSQSEPLDPFSDRGLELGERESVTVKRMHKAHAVLKGSGRLSEQAVRHTCELNENTGGFSLPHLKYGLQMLAEYWRLTGRQNRRKSDGR